MGEDLYYLLIEQNLFTHGIGRINEPDVLWKFENILKTGGLFSKEILKKVKPTIKGKVSGNIRFTSECYVSVFDPSLPNLRKRLLRSDSSNGLAFSVNDITFLIDSAIELELPSKRNYFDSSEIMVEESVPIEYFSGIVIPNNKEFLKKVCSIMKRYRVDLPIYDGLGKCLNNSDKKMYYK